MTIREEIALTEQAIQDAEATIDNPHLPEAAHDAAEKALIRLSNKLIELKHELKLLNEIATKGEDIETDAFIDELWI